ncbi:hypothetical protein PR003_g14762 [Phytophthora rubi]|uniref:GST C-terminal domain-containing protein n=1 Tax=Phytophthora rubi TaxID=129364 RepID=A0A6A3LTM9_9STRA|nr:hypothetical protein PR002_g14490 [Phytophthora rubi]KAE9019183.1 hypothetical protein PR001_g13946 [Phytophthora rubi]KAE9331941.1 hypothetical protein PR003_g14762 [Phytophthora rubi]
MLDIRLVAPRGLDAVRIALDVGGLVFEDKHSEGQEPELVVNGKSLTQPQAMLRCAGRLGGSYPVTSPTTLTLRVDEILDFLSEVEAKMKFASDNFSEVSHSDFESIVVPRYASMIEARLGGLLPAANGHDLLLHEVKLYCWVKALRELGLSGEIDKHKRIREAESKVGNHPRVVKLRSLQVCSGVPKLKLVYFPFPGRAEPIRLALFIGGIQFEDERVSADELDRRRSSLPFNQLPVLYVDGDVISQALAILRYAGTLAGLYSQRDYEEAFRINEVFSLIDEFYSSYIWNASYFEKDPVKQVKLHTTLAEDTLPKTLDFIEKRVTKWTGPHAVGKRLTVADLAIYSLLWTFKSGRIAGVPVTVVEPFKNLLQVYKTVSTHTKVVQWAALSH